MSARRGRRFVDPGGRSWFAEVRLPGASNAMVVFHDEGGQLPARYAWHIWRGPEARSVTSRVPAMRVLESLTNDDIALLFRKSAPISTPRAPLNLAVSG
jgi:hypothetical protein